MKIVFFSLIISALSLRRRLAKHHLIVSKNLDVMKTKAQFSSKRGSVVFYVTKRVACWNAVLRAC